jgi:hypothetical protein
MAKKLADSPPPAPPDEPTGTPPQATPPEPTAPKSVPNRGIRKRVLGEGEGDYCISEIVGENGQGLPRGSLLPLPKVPRFIDTAGALKWIRNESGDLLAGKQVMVFRACEILSLMVESKPTVVIACKPKVTVHRPETSNG